VAPWRPCSCALGRRAPCRTPWRKGVEVGGEDAGGGLQSSSVRAEGNWAPWEEHTCLEEEEVCGGVQGLCAMGIRRRAQGAEVRLEMWRHGSREKLLLCLWRRRARLPALGFKGSREEGGEAWSNSSGARVPSAMGGAQLGREMAGRCSTAGRWEQLSREDV
jgi:hypothetical protein